MFLSARLRSLTTVATVIVFLGLPAAPLALCAFESGSRHCAADAGQMASHDGHRESTTPADTLTCCCDAEAIPPGTATTTPQASAPLMIAGSPADAGVVDDAGVRPAVERTGLLARQVPLFTLFSAFLI